MDQIRNRFEYGAHTLLLIITAMMPLWFLPLPVTLEFGREVTFSLCIIAAFILWLLSVLTQGKSSYPSSLVLLASACLTLVFAANTIFSQVPLISFIFGDPIAEKSSSLFLGILLMLVSSSICSKRDDIRRIVGTLIGASALAGVFAFFQLAWGISLLGYITPYAKEHTFNVVGTMNGFALFLVTIFLVTIGLLFSSSAHSFQARTRHIMTAILVVFMFDLMMIHSRISWIVLLGSLIFFFGLMLMYAREGRKQQVREWGLNQSGLDWRYSMLILLIAFSVVMLIVKTPVFGSANMKAEVSPSFTGTLLIAKKVFQEGTRSLLLGSGPATFNLDWARYRNPLVNQTQFWNASFTQGFSWITTMPATIGIIGVCAFLLFIGIAWITFLRHLLLLPREEYTPMAVSIFLGFISLVFIALLYPASLTFVLMLFFFIGMLLSLFAKQDGLLENKKESETVHIAFEHMQIKDEEAIIDEIEGKIEKNFYRSGWWDVTRRTIFFESSWLVFVSSLLAIFFLSLGVAAMYVEVGRFRASMIQARGVDMFTKGDIDGAIVAFQQAITFEDKNFVHHVPLIQARMEQIRKLIQRATNGNNVQQEFQNVVSLAIQNSQQVIELYPTNPSLRKLQGSLYELLIPFIPGSENFAFSSYRKAIELDPINPLFDIDLARAGLISVDRLALAIQQTSGNEREQFLQTRTKTLQEVIDVLGRAVELKPDLADTHFLATQAALRLGNIAGAIGSAEKAKLAAPFDIGIAFQLGVLYYQAGNSDKAQLEFERVIALNNNYSNARYFLGLIYDQKGDTKRAIEQFEQIEKLNPNNQEVKHILENLRLNKGALNQIVPPAQPPEKRNTAPIK